MAICYGAKYETDKIVLLSSPFRPSKKKTSLKVKIYKFIKKLKVLKPLASYLQNKWGSEDYKNATGTMRGTLVNVVNEDLTSFAKDIKVPVLLIYGKEDEDVPLSEAKALESLIEDCGLIEYDNAHHYAYLEKLNDTITILNNFLE